MRKLKVVLLAGLLAIPILLGGAAAPVAASCSQAKVILYDSRQGQGTKITICYPTNDSNLTDNAFNDKAESVEFVEFTIDTAVCIWTSASYTGNGLRFINNTVGAYNLNSPFVNSVSSIEWGNNCLAAGVSGTP